MGSIRSRNLRIYRNTIIEAQRYTREQLGRILAEMLEKDMMEANAIKMMFTDLLLDLGADVNMPSPKGSTPLIEVSRISVALDNPLDIAKALLEKGADVNATDYEGCTALMAASSRASSTNIVRVLIDSCANVNARDNQDQTPLMYSAGFDGYSPSVETMELLLDRGADINASDIEGRTLLMRVATCRSNGLEIIPRLVSWGADVDAVDKAGMTALFYAAERFHSASMRSLIDVGANINHATASGDTALIRICSLKGSSHSQNVYEDNLVRCANVLLEKGADARAINSEGMTALRWARRNRRGKLVAILLAAGA